jgi:hypothetical protein
MTELKSRLENFGDEIREADGCGNTLRMNKYLGKFEECKYWTNKMQEFMRRINQNFAQITSDEINMILHDVLENLEEDKSKEQIEYENGEAEDYR